MKLLKPIFSSVISVVMLSCAMTHSLQRNTPTADIHLPGNGPVETPEVEDVARVVAKMRRISMNGGRDSAYLAEVERDSTGEVTIKGENIQTVYIVAKSKTVAERNGEIAIDFIVGIPAALQSSTWGLSLIPVIENNGMEEALQPLSIRGELFSDIQKRQYWQMNKYLNRILDDSTELTTTTSLAVKYYEAYNRYVAGGQKRRVAVAGVMAMKPRILVLDEPAAGLDPEGRDDILSEVKEYHKKTGTTVLLVSHSMEDIAKYANRVLVMSNKKIAMYDTVEKVFARAPELLELGLSVPQVTKIFLKLREMGVDVPADVYTIPYAVKTLLEAKRRRDAGESLVLPRSAVQKGGAV